jgi:glutathione synthase/RimK-type ligase-like ATP-grasp enzyme
MFIFGYQFPVNDAVADCICKDKSATYELLTKSGLNAVEHHYFTSPKWHHYTGNYDDETRLNGLLITHNKLVLKPNEGTGGRDVFFVNTVKELDVARNNIFKKCEAMAVSPFYNISEEYRCIVYDDKVRIIYRKVRPTVTGDGKSKIIELMKERNIKITCDDYIIDLNCVPESGVDVILTLKHNLCSGAYANSDIDLAVKNKIEQLAINAVKVIKIRFSSVDIIEVDGELKILEINSGVMAEKYAAQSNEHYIAIKDVYKDVILDYLL